MMPAGPILLVILTVLISTGFLRATLERTGLSVRMALLGTVAMLAGSLVEFQLTPGLSLNLGTGLLPLCVGFGLLLGCRDWREPVMAVGAAFAAAGCLAVLSRWLPAGQPTELNLIYLDAQYFYALIAGVIGYLVGHTRPAAFAGAVLGVLIGDIFHYLEYVQTGAVSDLTIRMSGGGFHGTAVVAGVLALGLADLFTAPPVERGPGAMDRHLPQP